MKLELKHIKAYPPSLHLSWKGVPCQVEGIDYYNNEVIIERVNVKLEEVKLILKPLKDAMKDEEFLDEFSLRELEHFTIAFFCGERNLDCFDFLCVTQYNLLLEKHYDVFGLFDEKLAISKEDQSVEFNNMIKKINGNGR